MIKQYKKRIILFIFLVALIFFVRFSGIDDYITFENLKANRENLQEFVKNNYLLSVLSYIIIYISTAFFLPAAIPLTIAGGLLFGIFWGTAYVCLGAIIGATLAFFTARYLIGEWLQDRYRNQLRSFNKEMARHGHYYLILIRLAPIFPFFLINYLAGLTQIPFRVFLLTFLVILLPGSVIYTSIGHHLGTIESLEDILSVETLLIMILLLAIVIFSFASHRCVKNLRKKG
jgi:uncharacterized membrane protein YdjX (TVP38/TMEM64 family)